jgi:AcrR family transcriptional regulator
MTSDIGHGFDKKRGIRRLHDARAVRSRTALRRALLELLETRPFDQITIKEITEYAGVSYPVFFRQFSDKEGLLADVATEQVGALLDQASRAMNAEGDAALLSLCRYVEDHRKLWVTLLTGGASAAMRSEFSRISTELSASRPRSNPDLPPDLVTELVTNGIFDILTWWLRQPVNYPIGNIVKLMDAFVVRVHTRPVKLELE